MVDDHCAMADSLKYAIATKNNGPDIRIVTYTAEYDFSVFGCGSRCVDYYSVVLRLPRLGLGSRPVLDSDFVASAGKISGHGIAHDSQTNERDMHFPAPTISTELSYAALA